MCHASTCICAWKWHQEMVSAELKLTDAERKSNGGGASNFALKKLKHLHLTLVMLKPGLTGSKNKLSTLGPFADSFLFIFVF